MGASRLGPGRPAHAAACRAAAARLLNGASTATVVARAVVRDLLATSWSQAAAPMRARACPAVLPRRSCHTAHPNSPWWAPSYRYAVCPPPKDTAAQPVPARACPVVLPPLGGCTARLSGSSGARSTHHLLESPSPCWCAPARNAAGAAVRGLPAALGQPACAAAAQRPRARYPPPLANGQPTSQAPKVTAPVPTIRHAIAAAPHSPSCAQRRAGRRWPRR